MAIPQYARSSHQDLSAVTLGRRQPFACPAYQSALNELSLEAIKAAGSTTQAAYLLRLNNIRRIIKSLG